MSSPSSQQSNMFASSTVDLVQASKENVNESSSQRKVRFPYRYRFAIMAFLGLTVVFTMRISLSVAIVAMVSSTSSSQDSESQTEGTCPAVGTTTNSTQHTGDFNWNEQEQALVLGSYGYGYVAALIPGGLLTARFGGKKMFLTAVAIITVFNLLGPLSAGISPVLLMISRALVGVGGGIMFPSTHTLLGKWAPPVERSKISTFVYAGMHAGSIIGTLITGILCDSDFLGGWPASFYVFGVCGVIWFILAFFCLFDSPQDHPRISEEERLYIQTSIGVNAQKKRPPIPWKEMFTSPPVYAIMVAQFAQSWSSFVAVIEMPTYISSIYHVDVSTTSVISAFPFLACWMFSLFFGWLSDFLRKRGILSDTNCRKFFQTLSQASIIVLALCIYFMGCNYVATVVLFIAGIGVNTAFIAGYFTNHIDLSPTFGGTMFGISSCFANFGVIFASITTGSILKGNSSQSQWGKVYMLQTCVSIVSIIFYLIFGSAVQRKWDEPPEKTADAEDPVNKAVKNMSAFHITFVNNSSVY